MKHNPKHMMKRLIRTPFLLVALLLVGVLGLTGCFRGHWHHGEYSEERFQEHAAEVREEIAEELELRPEQMPAFNTLMDAYQETLRDWRSSSRERSISLKQALEQQPVDTEAVRAILKGYVREKPADQKIDELIDRTVDFYAQLDPAQQEDIREHMLKHLRRRFE